MWELDHRGSWRLKNWFCWTVVLQKTVESPLGNKEIKPLNPKGNQLWIFIGRTDPEAEVPIIWPLDAKLTHWKRLWSWERLRHEEKGMTEDEMTGWHQWFNGHEFEQTPEDSEGQGRLVCCSPWGYKLPDWTTRAARQSYLLLLPQLITPRCISQPILLSFDLII